MFDNTEIAFSSKSSAELKKAHWLFFLMQFSWLSSIGKLGILLALRFKFPIRKLIKNTIFQQFVGGENETECLQTVDKLFKHYWVGSILDYAVEGKLDEISFNTCKNHIVRSIDLASKKEAIPFAVFKMTGICSAVLLQKVQENNSLSNPEKQQLQNAFKRSDEIVAHAKQRNVPLLIDAEESWIQSAIDDIAMGYIAKFNTEKAIIYTTLQCYRNDSFSSLKEWIKAAKLRGYVLGVKLVRGAYMEKEREMARSKGYKSPICITKEETDISFDNCVKECVSALEAVFTVVATHNEQSIIKLVALLKTHNIAFDNPKIFSAQLYGMSDHITFNLIKKGLNVVKYMPYGPLTEVLPYLLRRANENKSIQGQSSRELKLIQNELKRREKLNAE